MSNNALRNKTKTPDHGNRTQNDGIAEIVISRVTLRGNRGYRN